MCAVLHQHLQHSRLWSCCLHTSLGIKTLLLVRYPVFPWVIRDYQAEQLDLGLSSAFRDLSKPVGALDPKRLDRLRQRYADMRGDPEVRPPFVDWGSPFFTIVLALAAMLTRCAAERSQVTGSASPHAVCEVCVCAHHAYMHACMPCLWRFIP